MAELLPWICLISDGVVACKDGGLLACFELSGVDSESITQVEYDAMLQRAASAFGEMSVDPWSIIFTLHNQHQLQYPAAPMDNEAARALDAEHWAYVNERAAIRPQAYLSIHLGPPSKDDRFFDNAGSLLREGAGVVGALWRSAQMLFSSRHAFAYRALELAGALERVEASAERLQVLLSAWGLRRLRGDELVGFLRQCIMPDRHQVRHARWRGHWFLDSQLPEEALQVLPDSLLIGQRHVVVFSIKDWPQATHPSFVQAVTACGVPSVLSVSFRMMDRNSAKKAIQSIKSYAELTQYSLKDYVAAVFARHPTPNEDRSDRLKQAIIRDANTALDDMADGAVFGYMNVTLAVYAGSRAEAEDAAEFVSKRVMAVYPGLVRERLHALGAWSATLPGQFHEPVRWSMMTVHNLVESAPVVLPSIGEPHNRYLTEQTGRACPALTVFPASAGGHFYFNFHRGALAHTFLVGSSRSGKSVMVNFLLSQFTKYYPSRVVIFDKDRTCRINVLMHDGVYYDPVHDRDVKLNPLRLLGDARHWDWLVRWLSALLESGGRRLQTQESNMLREAVEDLARNRSREHWRLANLVPLLPMDLRTELLPFVEGGQFAHYFDNAEDSFDLAPITAYEMGDLLRNQRLAPLFIEYAFYRIQMLLQENFEAQHQIVPTAIYLEECWFLFENPVFQERIRDWLKTLAKYSAFLIMATQSIEDMVSDNRRLFASIRDNIATMIFLPNARAATRTVADVYKREFGLTDETVEMIASSVPRRDYIIVTDQLVKKVFCEFNPKQLAYLRSDARAQSIFDEEYQRGDGWKERYLQRITA
ncbi:MAG: hypothetical protein N2690_00180 [Rhodocyclaceae bacterium]|nr:hypothetical protein [Rhodocyclaceae bacterium]